jgi:hypothetical protein
MTSIRADPTLEQATCAVYDDAHRHYTIRDQKVQK